jgi:menaquinone-specific isochorismate synthase
MAARRYDITKRGRGYLPHWEGASATYLVTFRLADSLPRVALERLEFERRDLIQTAARQGRVLTEAERRRLAPLHSKKIEAYLDSGAGACYLSDPRTAGIVAAALRRFDGRRYRLLAWCVMPNHVHVVFQTLAQQALPDILHSWKSFTANKANALLRRRGVFWQREYFDHLLRTGAAVDRAVRYVLENPAKAALKDWKWVWARSPLS